MPAPKVLTAPAARRARFVPANGDRYTSPVVSYKPGAPAVGAAAAVKAAAAVLATGGPQVFNTGLTQPDVPRCLTATAGGTAGDIKAVSVSITGTNIYDEVITEVLPAFTVDTAGTVTGVKAFKTVTSISVPAMDGTGATVSIGTSAKIGLPDMLDRNTVIAAYLNGTKEGTAPTVVVDNDEVEKNVVTLNSALNGTAVVIDYYL